MKAVREKNHMVDTQPRAGLQFGATTLQGKAA